MSNLYYSKAIVPNPNYKISLDLNSIKTKTDLLLARRSNKSYTETFDELGFLREQAILPIEMPNLSLNLLGAKFKVNHINYIQKNRSSESWQGEKIDISELLNDIEKKKNSTPIFIWYNDLNDKSFPYRRPKEQIQISMLESLGYDPTQIPKKELIPLNGIIKIIHTPTKSNYWHVELIMVQSDGKLITRKNTGSSWGGNAAQTILDIIVNNAFGDINKIETDYKIQKKDYLN